MSDYPKNPVSNSPSGRKIPASWQNRRSPFDENPVSDTGFALQDNIGFTEINAERNQHSEAVDGNGAIE